MTRSVSVRGWSSLNAASRARLLATCIDGCGRPREGRSERCAACKAERLRLQVNEAQRRFYDRQKASAT